MPALSWQSLNRTQKLLALVVGVVAGIGIVAAAVVVLTSGGSESVPAVQATTTPVVQLPDACGLVTLADATQVFGKLAIESESQPEENERNCSYNVTSAANGMNGPEFGCPLGLGVEVWSDGSRDLAKNEKVPGLGDEAYWTSTTGTASLWVRRSEFRIAVALSYDHTCIGRTPDSLASQANEKVLALASTSLSRLP